MPQGQDECVLGQIERALADGDGLATESLDWTFEGID